MEPQFIRYVDGKTTRFINIQHICSIKYVEGKNHLVMISTTDGSELPMEPSTWKAIHETQIKQRVIWDG
jgi:hypothetical protein